MTSKFGNVLREVRTTCNKTLKDLAEALEVSVVYISDIERGRRNPPSYDKILKIADFLNITPINLLDAAAIDRDRVELQLNEEAQSISNKAALALARRWPTITNEQLTNIIEILDKE